MKQFKVLRSVTKCSSMTKLYFGTMKGQERRTGEVVISAVISVVISAVFPALQ